MKKLVPTAVATGMFYVVFSNLIYPRLDTTIGKDLLFWLILLAACAVWVLIRKTRQTAIRMAYNKTGLFRRPIQTGRLKTDRNPET